MNRKQKIMQSYHRIAQKAVDAHMEYKLTSIMAGVVLAMDAAGCKVKYDKFLQKFQEIYPDVMADPETMKHKAEDIADQEIYFLWPEEWEDETIYRQLVNHA